MDHEQKRHAKHEKEREEKQLHERLSEEEFSRPGPTIRPLWFLVIGLLLTGLALVLWMRL
jgi:hypothetical protein